MRSLLCVFVQVLEDAEAALSMQRTKQEAAVRSVQELLEKEGQVIETAFLTTSITAHTGLSSGELTSIH